MSHNEIYETLESSKNISHFLKHIEPQNEILFKQNALGGNTN